MSFCGDLLKGFGISILMSIFGIVVKFELKMLMASLDWELWWRILNRFLEVCIAVLVVTKLK